MGNHDTCRIVNYEEELGVSFFISESIDIASQIGCSLYLCGHTHARQICFPGGVPLVTHQYEERKYYKELWKVEQMQGYTNAGCGV